MTVQPLIGYEELLVTVTVAPKSGGLSDGVCQAIAYATPHAAPVSAGARALVTATAATVAAAVSAAAAARPPLRRREVRISAPWMRAAAAPAAGPGGRMSPGPAAASVTSRLRSVSQAAGPGTIAVAAAGNPVRHSGWQAVRDGRAGGGTGV